MNKVKALISRMEQESLDIFSLILLGMLLPDIGTFLVDSAKHKLLKCRVAGVGYLGQSQARIYSEPDGFELVGVFDFNNDRDHEIAGKYKCQFLVPLKNWAITDIPNQYIINY